MWKRGGSGKPQRAQQLCGLSRAEPTQRQVAVERSRLLASYGQEVARSSRAPPILASPIRRPAAAQAKLVGASGDRAAPAAAVGPRRECVPGPRTSAG
jgi:hypothetical protein